MKDYLIKDFTDVTTAGKEPTIRIVDEKEMWKIFQSLKEKPRDIAIYKVEIGDCIVDWS